MTDSLCGQISFAQVAWLSGKAVIFLAVAIALGIRLAPVFIRYVGRMKARGPLIVYSVLFAVVLAAIADLIGLAAIRVNL